MSISLRNNIERIWCAAVAVAAVLIWNYLVQPVAMMARELPASDMDKITTLFLGVLVLAGLSFLGVFWKKGIWLVGLCALACTALVILIEIDEYNPALGVEHFVFPVIFVVTAFIAYFGKRHENE